MSEEVMGGVVGEANTEAVAGSTEPVNAGSEDATAYAYVKAVGSDANGAFLRVAEEVLNEYLLDVVGLPFNGGVVEVPAAFPATLKVNDKSAEAVRGFRAAAEKEGFMFQWIEVSKQEWEEAQA